MMRTVGQSRLSQQRRPRLVIAKGVGLSEEMRFSRNAGGVQLIQFRHITKDIIQLRGDSSDFLAV